MGLRTVEQLRQARAALGWTQAKVAEAAGVSVPTIKRLENGSGNLAVRFETLQTVLVLRLGPYIQPNQFRTVAS